MDLGIRGRKAIVCAASQGLGRACAAALAREGVELVMNARCADMLETAAEEIRHETGAAVLTVAADIGTEQGRARVLDACRDPDILVNNAGGPPAGGFRDWGRNDWMNLGDLVQELDSNENGSVKGSVHFMLCACSLPGYAENSGIHHSRTSDQLLARVGPTRRRYFERRGPGQKVRGLRGGRRL
jgi:NAD(P)-dependent dehydrogenase (short-subunit alcohol dehydrogenase family)